jgi:hypothetical protein
MARAAQIQPDDGVLVAELLADIGYRESFEFQGPLRYSRVRAWHLVGVSAEIADATTVSGSRPWNVWSPAGPGCAAVIRTPHLRAVVFSVAALADQLAARVVAWMLVWRR